jgi:hypothetical protein
VNHNPTRTLFLIAAIFNWLVALALFFAPDIFMAMLHITPAPLQLPWLQQFAGLVFVFGIGYFWASRDLAANAQIIRLAVIAKLGVVIVALYTVLNGSISWQMLIPAGGDLLFAIWFIRALRRPAHNSM